LKQVAHICQCVVKVYRLRLKALTSGKRQELGRKHGASLGSHSHMPNPLF
jgi:hypothetical protein